jgi:uncharacterized protein DUF6941
MDEQITVDFLMLANHVENVNGLLYISGGGWTDHRRAIAPGAPPPMSHLGIGASVTVPWNQTNHQHTLAIRVEDDDGNAIAQVSAQMNVGRPPQLPPGAAQPVMLGLSLDLQFPRPGGYRLVAQLDGEGSEKKWPFRVHDIPVGPAPSLFPSAL